MLVPNYHTDSPTAGSKVCFGADFGKVPTEMGDICRQSQYHLISPGTSKDGWMVDIVQFPS